MGYLCMPGGHFSWRTSENSVMAKFAQPRSSAPEPPSFTSSFEEYSLPRNTSVEPLPLWNSILPNLFVSRDCPVHGGIKIRRKSGVLVSGCRFQLFLGEARC